MNIDLEAEERCNADNKQYVNMVQKNNFAEEKKLKSQNIL